MTRPTVAAPRGGGPVVERPILFSGPMVRAILDGRKTQTRRVVKAKNREPYTGAGGSWAPYPGLLMTGEWGWLVQSCVEGMIGRCPYGAPGDRLWVRETWEPVFGGSITVAGRTVSGVGAVHYKAGGPPFEMDESHPHWSDLLAKYDSPAHCASDQVPCWLPSIHMPRWASRLMLEVTGVRVERLQAITEEDAKAEGVLPGWSDDDDPPSRDYEPVINHTIGFANLWDTINGKRAPWASNPWVWVVEFRRAA